ncbi:acyl-CoA dehydrogenase domain protein [Mycobacterium xenopi 3993]|nr:acyl-CoA dehydrogenase domain protein [Mycobacterium xenopi 3993]
MQLALTDAEAAFRDELRAFYTSKIPAEIRERVRAGLPLSRDDIVTSHKILNDHGLAVPNWPVEWAARTGRPLSIRSGSTRCNWQACPNR